MEQKELGFLLALHRALHLTQSRYEHLGSFFQKKWSEVWKSSPVEFSRAGIDKKGCEKFFTSREKISPDEELEKLFRCGAHVLCADEEEYPPLLKNIYSPPALLFFRGEIPSKETLSLGKGALKVSSEKWRETELRSCQDWLLALILAPIKPQLMPEDGPSAFSETGSMRFIRRPIKNLRKNC
jgi:predicted Rossmann fold nucleotide-binding protein DprA/Smf involved in DNA uptake